MKTPLGGNMYDLNQKFLVLDYETFSECDIKRCGSYEYSMHPSTEVLCVSWMLGTRKELRQQLKKKTKATSWAPKRPWNKHRKDLNNGGELAGHLKNPEVIVVAHNALFEQAITRNVLTKHLSKSLGMKGPFVLDHSRFFCTAALASVHALPRKLDGATSALGLHHLKDDVGHRLMLKLSKPRKKTKLDDSTRHTKPEEHDRLIEYCEKDIYAEVGLFLALDPLIPSERALWLFDQKINFRGVKVDRELVKKILVMINEEKRNLTEELRRLTCGFVQTAGQKQVIHKWLKKKGVTLPNLQGKTVEAAIKDGTVEGVAKKVLQLCQQLNKTSLKKYSAFINHTNSDSISRFNLNFNATVHGRWGGAGIQMHNLPRGTLKHKDEEDKEHDLAPLAAEQIKNGANLEMIRTLYGDPIEVFVSCLRTMIIADEGEEFFVTDFAAIEARVLFWLSGHEEGVKAFVEKRKMYEELAMVIFNHRKLLSVLKDERFVGKQAFLGCLAKGSLVKTENGFKPIEKITNEKLWDGVSWVNHEGLLVKGLKNVIKIEALNIELTPDHWLLTKDGWKTSLEVKEELEHQGLEQETWVLKLPQKNLKSKMNVVSMCAAYVELKKGLELINFTKVKDYFVKDVGNLLHLKTQDQVETLTSYFVKNLESVGQLVSTTSKRDVATFMIKTSTGMVVGGLEIPSTPLEVFWNTLLNSMGLIGLNSRWTELTMTKTMCPETYEWLLKNKTIKTEIKETYDIKNCGPNRCFQVENVLAHNSGYGMGWKKFQKTCEDFGQTVTAEVAKKAINAYRELHKPVVDLWGKLEKAAISAVLNPTKTFKINKTKWFMKGKFLVCELPSGRSLFYYGAEIKHQRTPWGDSKPCLYHWTVDSKTKKWVFTKTWGGIIVQNCLKSSTYVFTHTGIKKLIDVKITDKLFDGEEWINHDGIIYKGKSEVIEWEGIKVTQDHMILGGNSWEKATHWALNNSQEPQKKALSLVNFWLSNQQLGTVVKPFLNVNVEKEFLKIIGQFFEDKNHVQNVHQEKSLIQNLNVGNFLLFGATVIQELLQDAIIKIVQLIKTTAQETSRFINLGRKTKDYFLSTFKKLNIGIRKNLISTESIMIEDICLETLEWSQEKLTVTTEEKHQLEKECDVYDILNSGPLNRFMILTDSGPVIVHNCVGGISRDLLAASMTRQEKAGYKIRLTVHDEVVASRKIGEGSLEEFNKLMKRVPMWAIGCPIDAEGFVTQRYHK